MIPPLRLDALIVPVIPILGVPPNKLVRRTVFAILLVLILLPASVGAQEPASGRIGEVDDTNYPEVRTIVTILDRNGRPITGLTASNFEASESGSLAQVSAVDTVLDQRLGVAVILVIDTSGSMEGAPILQAGTAAQTFVQNLQEPDEAAVISFADGVEIQSALTANRGQTLGALSNLVAVGNTALYSGVIEAIEEAQEANLPRKAVILLSDGQDFGGASAATRQEAIDASAEARVPVYAIGLGENIDQPFLESLASASGGAFFEAPAPETIPGIYDQLSQLLRSQYVVVLNSTASESIVDRDIVLNVETPSGTVELRTGYRTRRTIVAPTLPAPTATLPPSTPTPAPTVLPTAAVEDSGGGIPALLLVLLVGAVATPLGFLYYRRTKQRRAMARQVDVMSRRAMEELDQVPQPASALAPHGPTRRVTLIGPEGEESFEIGQQPVTIGSGETCQIKLSPGEGIAEAHARCWLREGQLMLHHLARGHQTMVGGSSVSWVSLVRGDEALIGPYRLRVED